MSADFSTLGHAELELGLSAEFSISANMPNGPVHLLTNAVWPNTFMVHSLEIDEEELLPPIVRSSHESFFCQEPWWKSDKKEAECPRASMPIPWMDLWLFSPACPHSPPLPMPDKVGTSTKIILRCSYNGFVGPGFTGGRAYHLITHFVGWRPRARV